MAVPWGFLHELWNDPQNVHTQGAFVSSVWNKDLWAMHSVDPCPI